MDGNEKARCEKLIASFKSELGRMDGYVLDAGRHGYVLISVYDEEQEVVETVSPMLLDYDELKQALVDDYISRRIFEEIDRFPSAYERERRTDIMMKGKDDPLMALDEPDRKKIMNEVDGMLGQLTDGT